MRARNREGLGLMDCLRLWVKDVDLERRQIVVRDGKGAEDRFWRLRIPPASPIPAPCPLQVGIGTLCVGHGGPVAGTAEG